MKTLTFFFSLLLLASCGSNKPASEQKTDNPATQAELKQESDMKKRIAQIDEMLAKDGITVSSLNYTKPDKGEMFQVVGYTLKDGTLLKLEEFFNDGNDKNNGRRIYYLNEGKPFFTRELVNQMKNGEFSYYDRITYYSDNGQPLRTEERSGMSEDEVEQFPYAATAMSTAPMERALRALNQSGEFATTFQGFVFQDAFTYLVVGENKADGFTSALKCDFQDQLITTLSANQKKYLGRTLKVNFQEYTDVDGLTQQIYTGGDFAQ